ncbi:MAG: 2,4-dihydroxyhept-2-ene-1,7-dioic acid aldolase [Chloroflexi bacterium]|nr:2,4-dihydroxyhept-2-ene-1,7-dioic acid aldolase [Chloroflexota bacterium]
MRPNKIKALWREDKPVSFAWMSTADGYAAELVANAGFDAMVLDMQHGMGIGPDRATAWLQAVSTTETVPFVRVPWNEPAYIQWVLDAGAYGVIVPLVGSREEAEKAGGACRYSPIGYRSVGPNRSRFYAGSDYMQHANEEIICLVMIEDIKAIDRLDEIAQAPGIDGFYVGPADLAQTMGVAPFQYRESDAHAEACQKILDAAKAHGLVAGIHCASPEEALHRFEQGFRCCPIFGDGSALSSGAATALKTVRQGLATG